MYILLMTLQSTASHFTTSHYKKCHCSLLYKNKEFAVPENRLVVLRRFSSMRPATLKTRSLAADVAGMHRTRFYKTDGNLHKKYIPVSSHSHSIIPIPVKRAFTFPFPWESHGTHGSSRLLLTSTLQSCFQKLSQ